MVLLACLFLQCHGITYWDLGLPSKVLGTLYQQGPVPVSKVQEASWLCHGELSIPKGQDLALHLSSFQDLALYLSSYGVGGDGWASETLGVL